MTNKDAFTILRLAYDEVYLHDLTDEEVQNYHNIGANMVNEAIREQSKREAKAKRELLEQSNKPAPCSVTIGNE